MRDYELIKKKVECILKKFLNHTLVSDDYRELYFMMGVCKVTYTVEFTSEAASQFVGPDFVLDIERDSDGFIASFETEAEPGDVLEYDFDVRDVYTTKVRLFLDKNTPVSSIDTEIYHRILEKLFVIRSIMVMGRLLVFARTHDSDTGIPNMVGFRTQYSEARKLNPDTEYAIVFVNLQNFKYVNERVGSKGGDEVIIRYSRMLTLMVDPDEGVCRLGGDNFLFFVKPENLEGMINRLSLVTIDSLETSPGRKIDVSAWIGIAANDCEWDLTSRIEHAGIANSFAKQRLKQPVVYYSDQFKEMQQHNKKIAAIFPVALTGHEFQAYFQAKVNMATGELTGFETLCRWIHNGSFIFPDQFIPVIDRLGLIFDLDIEILRLTCEAIRKWQDMGLSPPVMSVNFSRKDIFVPDVEKEIKRVVDAYGIDPHLIEIEITESASESEYARIIEFTGILKAMGFCISIDDFGTGYSSLSLIHNINADVLKIDKSFVSSIQKDTKTEVLVESIINIGKRLDMGLVAEGVETKEEGSILLNLGCEIAQGYYYSKPSDFETTTKILKDNPFRPIREG